jgi:hypothetical protein
MEIKILGSMPLWLTHLLCENELYSRGFSKYGAKYKQDAKNQDLKYHFTDKDGNELDFDSFM